MSIHRPPMTHRRTAWLVALALGAALASALLVGSARSAPQASELIAFTRSDGIYAMRSDGTGIRPLQASGAASRARALDWSPDGRTLAFVSHKRGQLGIWRVNADGTGLTRLVSATEENAWRLTALAWSPDGAQIAFPGEGGIWVVNADGSEPRLLVAISPPLLFAGSSLDWSPDGKRFAFTSGGYMHYLYVVDVDGRNLHRLRRAGLDAEHVAWSPSGHRIAFTRLRTHEVDIFVIDPGGRSLVRLTKRGYYAFDYDPTWSSDGARIAFVRGTWETGYFPDSFGTRRALEIYVMNADGGGVKRLTHNRVGEWSPAWQPVGLP